VTVSLTDKKRRLEYAFLGVVKAAAEASNVIDSISRRIIAVVFSQFSVGADGRNRIHQFSEFYLTSI
jgi:hypothetical protein